MEASIGSIKEALANAKSMDELVHFIAEYVKTHTEEQIKEDYRQKENRDKLYSIESIIDNKELMILILSELKKYYSCLVLRIDEEFDKRIKKAKSYGFVVKSVKQQGIYHYIELKIEL